MLMGNRWPGGRFLLRYPHPPPFPPQSRLHWSAPCHPSTLQRLDGRKRRGCVGDTVASRTRAKAWGLGYRSEERCNPRRHVKGLALPPQWFNPNPGCHRSSRGRSASPCRQDACVRRDSRGYVPNPSRPGRRSHASHAEKPRKQVLRKD